MAANKVLGQIGLLTLALRFEKATESENSNTHTVCIGEGENSHEPVQVKQSVTCPVCEKTASSHYGFPHRGVENAEGKLVVLTDDEIKAAKGVPQTGNITKAAPPITFRFHDREKVLASTLPAGSVYNVTPGPGGERQYAALRDYLRETPERVAVIIWATRTVNNLWVVEAVDDRLVASMHCWPEVVRPVSAVAPVELLDAEKAMFTTLAETLYSDFDPAEYVNASRLGLAELIASRAGTAMPVPVGAPPVSAGGDMMAMLQAAVEAAGGPVGVPDEKPAPKKRTTTKKATALPKQRTA